MDGEHKKCPYWEPDQAQQCLLTKGGLYIPMPEHVFLFCNSSSYTSCDHYIMGCRLLMAEQANVRLHDGQGRRRYQRYVSRYPLSISLCNATDHSIKASDLEAELLDVSVGGLQAKSNMEVAVGERLFYDVKVSLLADSRLRGSAEARWCRPDESGSSFFLGVAFDEQNTGQLAQCLVPNLV